MSKALISENLLTDIADAIRQKNGSSDIYTPAEMATAISEIPTGGGGSVSQDDVRFIDYDGTILYTYSSENFLALTEMPANPIRTGLISQGWNWTLADAKTYVTKYGKLNIGQMYITDDGKTRIYITIDDDTVIRPIYIRATVSGIGSVVLDWGDGTDEEPNRATGAVIWNHTYANSGNYIITLEVLQNTVTFVGSSSSSAEASISGNIKSNPYLKTIITKIELGDSVIIGNYAFYKCYRLSSITVPNYITGIGTYAFHSCFNLSNVTIPNNVTEIKSRTFQNCYSLLNVAIPKGVTSIENYAFYNCYSLLNITIPDNVTSIVNYTFYYCYSLSNITIPDSVINIGSYVFQNCSSLSNITIPDGVTSIGSYNFQGCSSLSNITIPDSVTSIGNYAFHNCYSLSNITIPDNVTSIGSYIFQNCYSLSNVIIPDNVTSIGSYIFQNCYSLSNVTISNNITSIGNYTFYNCSSLSNITIPDNVTSIGNYAFSGCLNLSNITIPDGVTSIGSYAFNTCSSLSSIIVPDSVTSIATSAFINCDAIKEFYFKSVTPPTLGGGAFNGIWSSSIFYVPAGSLEAYQTASNWSGFASRMQEEPQS